MKTIIQTLTILAVLLGQLLAGGVYAQSGPPPLPPSGRLLDFWPFSGTNYLSVRGSAPVFMTNVALVPTWAGNGLQVDSTNAAWITYAVVETNGMTNLNCSQGTIEMWFSPDWNSSDGLGAWGTILAVGNWNTNISEATGAWGIYISPDGSGIYFSAQTNGVITNYLNAPISWNAGDWHHIALTYSATNSALYVEGQLTSTGPGVSIVPGQNVFTNGFSIGSDSATGLLQARGVFNYLRTYNYELNADTIAADYADDSQFVYPLPSSGFMTFSGDDLPSPPGGGGSGSGTNSGGPSFNSPQYTTNDFWVEPAGIDTNGMLTLLVHATTNTSNYAPMYELLWSDSLTPPVSWDVYETFLGATNTNVTVLTVPVFPDEPTAFFEAVNLGTNGDSFGVGIPDWWQREYFGSVGIDPFGDPMGDGYDNLYKFEHGMNPNTYYAPAAPSLSAVLNTNGNIIISWPAAENLPSNGAGNVTGYTLEDAEPYGGTTYTNVTAEQLSYTNQLSYLDALSTYIYLPPPFYSSVPPTYAIKVNYANGSSQWSSSVSPFDPTCTVKAAVARGPNGSLYLVASSIPSNVGAIRIVPAENGMYYPPNWYGYDYGACFSDNEWLDLNIVSADTNWIAPYVDVPVSSISNGLYQIPPSQVPLFQVYQFVTLGVGTNGNFGSPQGQSGPTDWGNWYVSYTSGPTTLNIPFMDGRTNIQQNINFFLRSADVESPFSLYLFRDGNFDAFLSEPTNYVWDGFSDIAVGDLGPPTYQRFVPIYERNEFQPFEETTLFTNIVFNPAFMDASGNLTNGITAGLYYGNELDLVDPSKMFDAYVYALNNQSFPLAPPPFPALTQDSESWICVPPYTGTFQDNDDGSVTLPIGTKNLYGLPILSVKYFDYQNNWDTAGQGTEFYMAGNWDFFQDVSPPVLNTANYYFARPQIDPVPGQSTFTTTNTTPLFIAPFAQEFYLTAWAKQSISNGYSGVYAYPEQYFDKAYMADVNGNITTNETGLLSEYGDFFPLQPGKIFLTTKPDAATGTVGTNVVNVIKLQLDVNHDGIMDTSFAGPDNTTADRPFVFWINNDSDVPTKKVATGEDTGDLQHPDYSKTNIPSQRDLEDWARLWIVGLPTLSTNYQATLSWNVISGSPAINLVVPVESNGGILYLTDTNIAAKQVSGTGQYDPSYKIGTVKPMQPWTILPSVLTNGLTNCFLFEGAGIGKGELVLTISQNGTNVASTSAFIDLHDVTDFYEKVIITNTFLGGANTNMTVGLLKVEQPAITQENEDTNIIVYAHGADNTDESWLDCSDTIFKRLYWSGYRGKFSSVRWPSPPLSLFPYGFAWFNETEFIGYKSAFYLKNYATNLPTRFPGYNIHMWAHSAGGFIASEALSEGAPFTSLVLSSVTVSAGCYDINAPTNSDLLAKESWSVTPEWQPWGYHGAYTNLSANVFNYFNTNDDLLNKDWLGWDQLHFKPASGYSYDGTNSEFEVVTSEGQILAHYVVTDPQESRAMVARSRTAAIGAQGPLAGQTRQGVISSTVDVQAQFKFGSTDPEHGGFYMRAIQSILPYYYQVMTDCNIPHTTLQ